MTFFKIKKEPPTRASTQKVGHFYETRMQHLKAAYTGRNQSQSYLVFIQMTNVIKTKLKELIKGVN